MGKVTSMWHLPSRMLQDAVTCADAGFEYIGAGSNRNFSFTDLLLRHGNTDTSHLSAANWGVLEVKGPWQLSLPDGVNLLMLSTTQATGRRFCQLFNRYV